MGRHGCVTNGTSVAKVVRSLDVFVVADMHYV